MTTEYMEGPIQPPSAPRGRPKKFNPTPKADMAIKSAWHDEDRTLTYVKKIAKRYGYDVESHQLKYRYGNRFDEKEPDE